VSEAIGEELCCTILLRFEVLRGFAKVTKTFFLWQNLGGFAARGKSQVLLLQWFA